MRSAFAIHCQNVTLRHGTQTILQQVGLKIKLGEFIGVLGPNGAGKTSLMRAILGLIPVSTGRIDVFGAAITKGNTCISYLPQTRTTIQNCSIAGRELIAAAIDGHRFGFHFCRFGKAYQLRQQKIDEALSAVDALNLAQRSINTLSGGERQRLLLAQCLIGQPRILLLDEPLLSLDPAQQHHVVHLVKNLCRTHGLTVLFSAHELNPLIGALDRVLYLGQKQAAIGTLAEVMTSDVLSRLYGAPIEVIRLNGQYLVMSGGHLMEQEHHCI